MGETKLIRFNEQTSKVMLMTKLKRKEGKERKELEIYLKNKPLFKCTV